MILRLLRLLVLKQAAWLRHTLRSLRTPRRLVGVIAMAVLFGFFVWNNAKLPGGFSRDALAVLAGMMFVMQVASGLVQQGPRFTPADVDFLFPAPLSPRHLLLWRLLHLWPLVVVSTTFLWAMLGARLDRPFRFFVSMVLLQLTTTHLQLLIAVLMTRVGDTIARRLRGVGRILAVVALLGALLYLVVAVSRQGGLAVLQLADEPFTRFLFFPASACVDFVFGATPAETWFALLRLVLAAVGTLALLLLPEIDFREDSIATTARIARLLAARRRTGAAVDMEEGVRARSGAVPALRILFRASGAIVWKNLLLLVRSWKTVLPSLLLGLVLVLPVMFAMRDDDSVEAGASALVPIVMVTAFWSNALGFDLRRETDRLDQLRALPLSSNAIVFAELLLPWSLAVVLQEGLIAALSWWGHRGGRDLGVLALVLPVLTFLAVLIDNLAVFLFASRGAAGAARGAVASTSPAQLLRFVAWLLAATPGFLTVAWLAPRYGGLLWPVVLGVAVEFALALALFAVLVKWYESRELEPAE